jgi:hypothetical protein
MEMIIVINMIIFGRLCYKFINDLYESRGMELILKERVITVISFIAGALIYGALVFLLKNINAPQAVLIIIYLIPIALTAITYRDF